MLHNEMNVYMRMKQRLGVEGNVWLILLCSSIWRHVESVCVTCMKRDIIIIIICIFSQIILICISNCAIQYACASRLVNHLCIKICPSNTKRPAHYAIFDISLSIRFKLIKKNICMYYNLGFFYVNLNLLCSGEKHFSWFSIYCLWIF